MSWPITASDLARAHNPDAGHALADHYLANINDTRDNLDQQIAAFKTNLRNAAVQGQAHEDFLLAYSRVMRAWEPYALAQLLAVALERLAKERA